MKPEDRIDIAFTANDGTEIAHWLAYQLANGAYVPSILCDIYEKLVNELGLKEGGDG